MHNPRCHHVHGFVLIHNSIEDLYKWKCELSCGLSFPFSPEAAGKVRGGYFPDDPSGTLVPEWKLKIIAYTTQKNQKPALPLAVEGKV